MPMMESPGILTTLLAFVLVLGPLVFIHEFGHYIVGRWFGVKADVFSIGFGKELIGWTDKRGTRWKLAALPLGGYVQFAGDMNPASQPSAEWLALPAEERNRTFPSKPLYQRALIVLAGPVTNLLFAVVVIAGFALVNGKYVESPIIGSIAAGSAAERAGLKINDRILNIRGNDVATFLDVRLAIGQHPGEPLNIVVLREGRQVDIDVRATVKVAKDNFGNSSKIGYLGIGPSSYEVVSVGPVGAIVEGVDKTRLMMGMMVTGIGQIITGKRELQELGGPIKIAKTSGEQLVSGWPQFIDFVVLVSINLGFINLLPIPVLDGGHLAFYAAEAIRRKPVGQRGQEWAFRTGIAFVMALMLFVTINDVASLKLFGG